LDVYNIDQFKKKTLTSQHYIEKVQVLIDKLR